MHRNILVIEIHLSDENFQKPVFLCGIFYVDKKVVVETSFKYKAGNKSLA